MFKYTLRYLIISCLLAGFADINSVSAENKKEKKAPAINTSREVLLNIRAIKGNEPLDENADKSLARDVDKRIEDLSSKLASYDFKAFKLVSEQEITIPVKKKTTINLTEKTVLNVRPLYTEDKRVGLWVKWTDSSGDRTLIDTRLHFNADENMLAGTNCKNNKALILAISAAPVQPAARQSE